MAKKGGSICMHNPCCCLVFFLQCDLPFRAAVVPLSLLSSPPQSISPSDAGHDIDMAYCSPAKVRVCELPFAYNTVLKLNNNVAQKSELIQSQRLRTGIGKGKKVEVARTVAAFKVCFWGFDTCFCFLK